MRQKIVLILIVALSVTLGSAGRLKAQQQFDHRVSDLIQAGNLRAGVGVVAPHWAVKDAVSGELSGVAVDLARALAQRIGVQLVPVEYPSPGYKTVPGT
jgi:ABC-type amino acid transport substrate-binding protein